MSIKTGKIGSVKDDTLLFFQPSIQEQDCTLRMKINEKEFMMKRLFVNRNIIVSIFVVMLFIYSVHGISYAQDAPDTVAEFSDVTLATMVRRTLGLDTGDDVDILKIPKVELLKLKTLFTSESDDLGLPPITELTGLEHATQLITLYLRGQNVTDLTPLTQLTQLTSLDLWGNKIIDISPLARLTQLTDLDLGGHFRTNEIVDISPLVELTQLRELGLSGNEISDISPLAGLIELRELSLSSNRISDIGPLAGLTELTDLWLHGNQISDITPLTPLTKLTLLGLTTNQIRDITPIAQMKQLTFLQLEYNRIRDITPLAQVESLEELHLDHNQIRDLNPLTTLTRLTRLDLTHNQISDLTPLEQLSESLEELDLRDNRIRDVAPLANLIYLEELRLRDNPITDTFPLNALLDENPDLDIDIEVVREAGGPTLTVSTPQPLTVATLNGGVVTLTLSSGEFGFSNDVRDALTISGITGITLHWTDIESVSDTEVRIKLTFTGSIDKDATLVFTLGPRAIKNYNGSVLTAELPVSASAETVLTETSTADTPEIPTDTDTVVGILPVSIGSPAIGQQLKFSLNITGGEAVAGYQATVQFDTSALRYVSSANGNYLPAGAFFVEPKVEGNLVKLNAASLAGESEGDGTLATLTFEVITVKASALTLPDVLLTNSAGEAFVPQIENAEITEPTGLKSDVNADGIVNIQDLVLVASNLGQVGQNTADVNGDSIVNIQDLVLVAGALGTSAAAPSLLHPDALEILTSSDVRLWLSQAQHLTLTDTTSQRGILFLEQLLTVLIPKETALLANYPNPFNPETWIPYQLSKPTDVTLTIYDIKGSVVRALDLGHQRAGVYQTRGRAAYWDGRNAIGEPVASGLYFYTLAASDFTATRKMLIMK